MNYDLDVTLVETGASLLSVSGTDSGAYTIDVPFDAVSAIDLSPTICSLAGVGIPRTEKLDGFDARAVLVVHRR